MAAFPSIATSQFPLQEDIFHPQLKSPFESGHVQSRKQALIEKRKWKLFWIDISSSDYSSLEAFYLANIGNTLTWVHPISSTVYTVRFSNDSLKTTLTEGNNKRVELEIEEA